MSRPIITFVAPPAAQGKISYISSRVHSEFVKQKPSSQLTCRHIVQQPRFMRKVRGSNPHRATTPALLHQITSRSILTHLIHEMSLQKSRKTLLNNSKNGNYFGTLAIPGCLFSKIIGYIKQSSNRLREHYYRQVGG